MNHTLKQMLESAPPELRDAFFDGRDLLIGAEAVAKYDREWENLLMRENRKASVCGSPGRNDAPRHKRQEWMMT